MPLFDCTSQENRERVISTMVRDQVIREEFERHAAETHQLLGVYHDLCVSMGALRRELDVTRNAYESLEARINELERERTATHALPVITGPMLPV